MKKTLKRNPQVELMRIIACFIVLSSHCNFSIIVTNPSAPFKIYFASLLGDQVTIFWMITGFFLFNNNNYKKLWGHTFKKIILPLLILYVVDFYISKFVTGATSLANSFVHTKTDYLMFFKKLLCLRAPTSSAHTWYVLAYTLIILIYPLLKAFVDWLDADKNRSIAFLIISGCMWILNDVYMNDLLELGFHGAPVVIAASIEIIWGHIIYKNKDLLTKKSFIIIAPITFFAVNALRSFINYNLELQNLDNGRYLFWWCTSFAIICAIIVICFGFSVVNPEKNSPVNHFIVWLASYTYGIYLVHALVQEYITKLGYFEKAHDLLINHFSEPVTSALTIFIGAIIVLTICLIICVIIRHAIKLCSLGFSAVTKTNN